MQLTGMLWIGSGGGYITQTYIWCLLPALLSLVIDLHRHGLRSCLLGMTTGEKLLGVMFLWILVHPLLVNEGMDIGTVFNRVLKITLYLYAVRTIILHNERLELLLLLSAGVATAFAAATMIYQFGILGQPMGIRALGIEGYRVGILGVGEFAYLGNPILAGLYYGVFASILCGYMVSTPFQWKSHLPALLATAILVLFILLSGSRGPLMALLAMGGMALLLCQYSWKKPIAIALGVTGGAAALWLHELIWSQLNSVFADGFNCRFPIWQYAIDSIISNPFWGYGAYADFEVMCNSVLLDHPHNMLLNVSYYWGIPAGLIFIMTSTWSLLVSLTYRKQLLISIAGCILVFGQIGMLTDTYSFLIRPDLQWLLFFFPIAAISGARKSQKKDDSINRKVIHREQYQIESSTGINMDDLNTTQPTRPRKIKVSENQS